MALSIKGIQLQQGSSQLSVKGIQLLLEAPTPYGTLPRLYRDNYIEGLTETISITESISGSVGLSVGVSESISITETLQTTYNAMPSVEETISITESLSSLVDYIVNASETVNITETISAGVELIVSLAESIGITETIAVSLNALAEVSEAISITETLRVIFDPGYNPVLDNEQRGLQGRNAETGVLDFRFGAYGLMFREGLKHFMRSDTYGDITLSQINNSGIPVFGPEETRSIANGASLNLETDDKMSFMFCMVPTTGDYAFAVFSSGAPSKAFGTSTFVVGSPSSGEIGLVTTGGYHTLSNNIGSDIDIWVIGGSV